MKQINYVLYFESFALRDLTKKEFNKQFPESLVYELQEEDRLLAAINSGYFEFTIILVDRFGPSHQELLNRMMIFKQKMPLLVVANVYDESLNSMTFSNQEQIYFLKTNEIEDLPGVSLRILKEQGYHKRKYERKKSSLNLELGFDDLTKTGIQIKNLSEAGIQFVARTKLEKNECPYLFHRTLKGHNITVPIQILWKKQNSDGRWQYGAKYLSLN